MQLLNVAAAVLNQTPLAWDENKARIFQAFDRARGDGASIVSRSRQ